MGPDAENEEKHGTGFPDSELLFTQLVLSFQAAAWQNLGKVPSVISGKIDRNLEMAKHSIDMLGMLEEKTRGNLSENELKYLQHTLFELRMNYLDEMKKGPDKKEEPPKSPGEPQKSDTPPDKATGNSIKDPL
jgi:hypothetical protein